MNKKEFWTGALIIAGFAVSFAACSLVATRPVQLMSDSAAAIKAAREIQADTVAPELYRQATEWYFKARQEYKLKNFKEATAYATRAKHFAEQAEFQALRNGSKPVEPPPPTETASPSAPYDYPSPTGTPADVYEKRKSEEEAKKNPLNSVQVPPPGTTPAPHP